LQLERAVELNSQDPEALNYLGYVYAEEGTKLDEAEALISKALEMDPDNGAYIDSLGWVYYKKGMFEEAREQLEKAQKLVGDDAVVYDHLGDAHFKVGSFDSAKEAWQKSLEIENNDEVRKKLEELGKE